METLKGTFQSEELVVINLFNPSDPEWFEAKHGDTFANVVCSTVGGLQAPDFDGTTSGSQDGINVLIPRSALGDWKTVVEMFGGSVEVTELPVEAGFYGDGRQVPPVTLAEANGTLYWIE